MNILQVFLQRRCLLPMHRTARHLHLTIDPSHDRLSNVFHYHIHRPLTRLWSRFRQNPPEKVTDGFFHVMIVPNPVFRSSNSLLRLSYLIKYFDFPSYAHITLTIWIPGPQDLSFATQNMTTTQRFVSLALTMIVRYHDM